MSDPARIEQAQHLIFVSISELLIDLPDNVHELDRGLIENLAMIDRLCRMRPDLYARLKAQAEAKRAALRHGGHLTPASGARVNRPALSANPIEAYRYLMEGL